tara:strand:- start:1 stop:669 length:669 start_codon:yes stop_codon:yes gene_type:complete
MKLCFAIQARFSSRRLPGKVLMKVGKFSLIEFLIRRLKKTKMINDMYVLTSTNLLDKKIIDHCERKSINSFSGSLDNVFTRFRNFLRKFKYDAFVRISADSPFIDPDLVDQMVKKFFQGNYEIVTNVFPRTFPSGQSVEIVSSKTFMGINQEKLSNYDKEHVTSFFYKHAENFRIYNFKCNYSHKGIKLSIDTHEDLKRVEKIINNDLKNPEDYLIQDLIQG